MSLKSSSATETTNPGPISAMWAQLQQQNRWGQSSVLVSCESEVRELMKQIDLMVQSKRQESEQRQHELEAQLSDETRQVSLHKSALDMRQKEVGQLRSQIESMEMTRKDVAAQYEHQLNTLREEVCTMRRDYERLQRKYNKHARDAQLRDKQRSSHESVADVNELVARLEQSQSQLSATEGERRKLAKELEASESNNRTLAEKCNFLQNQSSSYQKQLSRRREHLDSTEQALREQLEQDVQLSRVKSSLDEALESQRRTIEEKEKVDEELRVAQQRIHDLEELSSENNVVRADLRDSNDRLRMTQDEVTSLTSDVSRISQSLSDKESSLKMLNEATRVDAEERQAQLRAEIEQLRNSLRKHKRHEKQLLDETTQLQERLDDITNVNLHLNERLAEQACDARRTEAKEINKLKSELSQLREAKAIEEKALQSKLDGMRVEVGELTAELHQRHIAMATLSEQSAALEKKFRAEQESVERKKAEMQVTTAQLDALRLENRHLRRSLGDRSVSIHPRDDANDGPVSRGEPDTTLAQIRDAYDKSVEALQMENERLKRELGDAREQLMTSDSTTQYKIESALRESQRTVSRLRNDEQRHMDEVKHECDRKVRDVEAQLQVTVGEYEQRLETLQSEVQQLRDELISTQRLAKHAAYGDAPAARNSKTDLASQHDLYDDRNADVSNFNGNNSLMSDEGSIDSADLAAAHFVAEQRQRTKQLEDKLDRHIRDLERSTDAALSKYLSPR